MIMLQLNIWINLAVWVALIVIAIVIELNTFQLVSVWFGGAALIALIVSAFKVDLWIQAVVFTLSAVILFLVTRPLLKKFNKQNKTETVAAESLIGELVIVTKPINKDVVGEIKAKFERYSATSDEEFQIGDKAKIIALEGNKVIVKKEDEE